MELSCTGGSTHKIFWRTPPTYSGYMSVNEPKRQLWLKVLTQDACLWVDKIWFLIKPFKTFINLKKTFISASVKTL